MELISRERAIEDICSIESEVARNMPYDKEWFDRMCDRQHEIIEIIKALPPVQIEKTGNTVTMTSEKYIELIEKAERPKGKLIEEWDGYRCSNCQIGFSEEIRFLNYKMGMPKFCPNCGAKMEKE